MNGTRLRLACGGLHPDRMRTLVATHGLRETLAGLLSGRLDTNARVRTAIAVPAEERHKQLAAAGVQVLFRGDDQYPQHLAALPDAPDVLFVRGRLPTDPGVAVIGSRRSTSYGRRIAETYGKAIAAAGWPLVSGLARGIDGAAHRGTVAAGGVGVAVLGSGIDVMYPREHEDLAREIITCGGAVISESPPGTPPEGWRFPPRNRVKTCSAQVRSIGNACWLWRSGSTSRGWSVVWTEFSFQPRCHSYRRDCSRYRSIASPARCVNAAMTCPQRNLGG